MNSIVMKSVLGALAGASLLLAAGVASAASFGECQTLITALRSDTVAATFVGRNETKDEAGLVAKLDGASAKLTQGKFCDAKQKVSQYKDKVNALCGEGKPLPKNIVSICDINVCTPKKTSKTAQTNFNPCQRERQMG